MHAKLWFDGSYNWHTKTATGGCVIEIGGKRETFTWTFGETTMNGCEFLALKNGIEAAKKLGATSLQIRGDSKLVVKCVKGEWRAKLAHIKTWRDEIVALLKTVQFDLRWIPREQNPADEYSRPAEVEAEAAVSNEVLDAMARDKPPENTWLDEVSAFIS